VVGPVEHERLEQLRERQRIARRHAAQPLGTELSRYGPGRHRQHRGHDTGHEWVAGLTSSGGIVGDPTSRPASAL
jgi:hypothetical protein